MKTNNLKIKILDRIINRNVDKQMEIVNYCDKNNIRLNDCMNKKVQSLRKLDDEVIVLLKRQDILIQKRRENTQKEYDKYLTDLKNEYQGFKYKIINTTSSEITYTNKIEKYIKDFEYDIYCILEGREYNKQSNKSYIEYDKKDSVYNITRKEVYTSDNKLIKLYLEKERKHSRVIYSKISNSVVFRVNNIDIFMPNKSSFQIEQIQKAIDSFENDKEIQELFNEYNSYIYKKEKIVKEIQELFNEYNSYIYKKEKIVKESIEDRFNHMLHEYAEVVEKHQDLKMLCDNKEVLKDKYVGRNGIKKFYKDYKINNENWSNYLGNYNRWKFLSNLDTKEIEVISKSEERFWRYPTRVWRWNDYEQMRMSGSY